MSKPTKHDQLTAIGIQIERLENFLKGATINRYSQGTIAVLQSDLNKLHERQDRIINPAPKAPRQPRKPKAASPLPADTERTPLTVIPVPDGLQHTSDVRKRSRRGD